MKSVIFAGIFAFFISLIYFTPLSFITPYLLGDNKNIIIEEPSGTIWSGEIRHLTVNRHYLGKANWTFSPLKSLTSLSLKTQFILKSDDIDVKGTAGVDLSRHILIDDTQFDINSSYINTLQNNVKLSGSFNGLIKHATLKEKTLPNIDGVINWTNGTVDTPFVTLEKGNYKAILIPESENIDIKLSSNNAPIELNGDIKVQSNWLYTTNVTINSKNKGLMAAIRLALSGKTQNDGSALVKTKGDLKPFIGLK